MAASGIWRLALAALLLTTGALAVPLRLQSDCVSPQIITDPSVDLFPATQRIVSSVPSSEPSKVEVAKNFEVTYYPTFKVVKNLYTWGAETYVLYQCGAPVPDLAALNLTESKLFEVPLRSVSVEDTSVLPFLKQLGVYGRVGFVTQYAVDPCMQSLGGCGKLTANATNEAIDASFVGYDIDAKNPLAIGFTATSDPGALNRAEYIKYLAPFFNREAVANSVFDQVRSSYEATKKASSDFLTATPTASKPLVAWLYYQPENQAWKSYGPTAWKEQVKLYFTQYRKDYIEDAGGRLHDPVALNATYGDGENVTLGQDDNSLYFFNLQDTLPVLHAILKEVDVVIDETRYESSPGVSKKPSDISLQDFLAKFGLQDPALNALTSFRFLASQRLLRLDGTANANGDTSWFEEAVARPDVVLKDLAASFQPSALAAANYQPRLVRSVFAIPRVLLATAAECPLQGCKIATAPICPAVYRDCDGKVVLATEQQPCAPTCTPAPAPTTPAATTNTTGGVKGSDNGGGAAGMPARAAGAAATMALALLAAALLLML